MFQDRIQAGRSLSARLSEFAGEKNLLVLALPRGGVPVGFEIARAMKAPLDAFLVRKLGVPGQEELAMGAIASGGIRLLDDKTLRAIGISPRKVEEITHREMQELKRREQAYRGNREALDVRGRTIILVDDGMATGLTMRAAVIALRQAGSKQIIVAVPVASREACREIEKIADTVVCLHTPLEFFAVGQWYENFSQTSDEEVHDFLDRARNESLNPTVKDGGFAGD